jgi:hypothetical protein
VRVDGALTDWHLLDARPIWVKELAGALSMQVNLTNWIPEISWNGYFRSFEFITEHQNPPLTLNHFPLQRGFSKWPVKLLVNEGKRIAGRLRRECVNESDTVLLCVSPHYASVARHWAGPVIYYMSDLHLLTQLIDRFVNEPTWFVQSHHVAGIILSRRRNVLPERSPFQRWQLVPVILFPRLANNPMPCLLMLRICPDPSSG